MSTVIKLLTAEEYARLPEEQDRPSELVRGVIVRMNPPRFRHGELSSNFAGLLRDYVRPRKLGRVVTNDSGVITERDPDTVRGPDVAYFSYARLSREVEVELYPPVLPELAVEVRSPSDRWAEVHRKVAEYLAAGVLVVCVVDDDSRTISLFYGDKPLATLHTGDQLTLPEIFSGFSVAVADVFE